MADIKSAFGSANQTITVTLTSLAASTVGAGRGSTYVDNSVNLFLDALVQCEIEVVAGTSANDRAIYIYAYGSVDAGTTYGDVITGADAALTLNQPTQLRLIGALSMPTTVPASPNNRYKSPPMSVAAAFGGVLPQRWGVFIQNNSGLALGATAGNHKVFYQGVYSTSI